MAVSEKETIRFLNITSQLITDEPKNSAFWGDKFMESFRHQKPDILLYLQNLNEWFQNNNMVDTLQGMPTVGKLLSQLSKFSLLHLYDKPLMELLNCFVNLSNLMYPVTEQTSSSTHQRAKIWAVDHFKSMTHLPVHGVDLFLLEEFGISRQEYMEEHYKQAVKQTIEHIDNLWESVLGIVFHRKQSPKHSPIGAELLIKPFGELVEVLNDESAVLVIQVFLRQTQNSMCDMNKTLLQSIFKTYPLSYYIKIFTVEYLDNLFSFDYTYFEEYMMDFIQFCLDSFPAVGTHLVKEYLKGKKLSELFRYNEKYFYGAVEFVKEAFRTLGNEPSLFILVLSITTLYEKINLKSNTKIYGEFIKEYKYNILSMEDQSTTSTDSLPFEDSWFHLVVHMKHINKSLLALFDDDRENISSHSMIWLHLLYPSSMHNLLEFVPEITVYINTLRNLITKKHIELSDLQYLSSSIKTTISNVVDVSIFTLLVNIVFLLKSSGGYFVMDAFLTAHAKTMVDKDYIFWLLYTIDVVLGSDCNLSNSICKALMVLFSQMLEQSEEGVGNRIMKLQTRLQVYKQGLQT